MNLCLVLLDEDDLRRTALCAFAASDAPFRVDNRSGREQFGCFLHRRSKERWKVAGKSTVLDCGWTKSGMVSGSESGLSTLSMEGSSGHKPRRMLWSTVGRLLWL